MSLSLLYSLLNPTLHGISINPAEIKTYVVTLQASQVNFDMIPAPKEYLYPLCYLNRTIDLFTEQPVAVMNKVRQKLSQIHFEKETKAMIAMITTYFWKEKTEMN